jgi:hypothetical protein
MTRKRARKPDPDKVLSKLVKALTAKTDLGRTNYLIDAGLGEILQNPQLDEFAHLIAELKLGKGTPEQRLRRWAKKRRKYGRHRSSTR